MFTKEKLHPIVILGLLSLATALVWVAVSVYQAIREDHAPNITDEILSPLDPSLDKKSLDKIEGARYFNEGEISPQ